jgi:hypothetical protein
LAVAAAWLAFHHLFFLGLMGCGEFLFGCGSTFVVNAESSPFSLLCFCYAQLCHD